MKINKKHLNEMLMVFMAVAGCKMFETKRLQVRL